MKRLPPCSWWQLLLGLLLQVLVPYLATVAGIFVFVGCAMGQDRPELARHAVVLIRSHGGSGTVIVTRPGYTLILSAAHMWEGQSRSKPIRLEAPSPAPGSPVRAGPRLVALDREADLALVELGAGPLPYCAPVAPAGYQPGRRCLSVGYDQLQQPPQQRPADLLGSDGSRTYTRQLPFHGRSGGALIDESTGVLVGVVSAYTGRQRRSPYPELVPGERGIYASLESVQAFLARHQGQGRRFSPEVQAPAPPILGRRPLPLCPT